MGLIHSRAAKQRDRAQAQLLRDEHREAMKGQPWYRQPTLGAMIGSLMHKRVTPTG